MPRSARRPAGDGRVRGGESGPPPPRTRVALPAAHQAVGRAPRGPRLCQTPSMAQRRRSSMLRLQCRLGRLLLRGGSHTCGDRTAVWLPRPGSLHPRSSAPPPGGCRAIPPRIQLRLPGQRPEPRSPWSCGFRGFALRSAPGHLPSPCPPLCAQVGPRRGVYSGGHGHPAHALTGHLSLRTHSGEAGRTAARLSCASRKAGPSSQPFLLKST